MIQAGIATPQDIFQTMARNTATLCGVEYPLDQPTLKVMWSDVDTDPGTEPYSLQGMENGLMMPTQDMDARTCSRLLVRQDPVFSISILDNLGSSL